jgi:hypothetical protein
MSTRSAIHGVEPGERAIRALASRLWPRGKIDVALVITFLISALFCIWTAFSAEPPSLHGGLSDRYNLLATALLHLHTSVGQAPASIMRLSNPYDPTLNGHLIVAGANDAARLEDDLLYHGRLYFVWGPAPALILLVPLHILGLEPSSSVTVAFYGIAGLGFALATLRVILKQIGGTPIWMCVLAAFALTLSSVVPFLLRSPSVSHDVLAGGFCFTMAGIWLAASALVSREASPPRLVLMSVCFGLAAGSRPTLALAAIVLIPVYIALRASRSRRRLLLCLALPVGVCFALLLGYNQARFGDPLQLGAGYQLSGYDAQTAPLGHFSYVLPGTKFYTATPPQLRVLFPFLALRLPASSFPAGIAGSEKTGGLLPMAPIVIFLAALPWLWRRRPALLGRLAPGLLVLALAGAGMIAFVSYTFYSATERYEADFFTLFTLGGLAAWLAVSQRPRGPLRRTLRAGGGLLAVWGCFAGVAVSFGSNLPVTHPGTWKALEDAGTPISTALTKIAGHPVLASLSGANVLEEAPTNITDLGVGPSEVTLAAREQVKLIVVSPGAQSAALTASVRVSASTTGVLIEGPRGTKHAYQLFEAVRGGAQLDVPVRLESGVNHLSLSPISSATGPAMILDGLSVAES